ncbi:MAG TPA: acyltransferase family protein, partial [Enterovirga sp.]
MRHWHAMDIITYSRASAEPAPTQRRPADDRDRVAWVDTAKGICIILVVMMHSTLGIGAEMGGEGFMHWVVAFAKPFRMPDFFLVSGLFLGRVIDRDWRTYGDKRVVHFVYFYLLWLLIQS